MTHSSQTKWAILAGGLGTRIEKIAQNKPKILLEVNGKTILEQQIEILEKNGIREIHLLLGFKANEVITFVNKLKSYRHVKIVCHIEAEPLGTGGALLEFLKAVSGNIGVSHGDLFIDTEILEFIAETDNGGWDWGQIVHPSNHVFDSDIVVVNESQRIVEYLLKPHNPSLDFRNLTNAGIYYFTSNCVQTIVSIFKEQRLPFDLDRVLLPKLLEFELRGYAHQDIGTCIDIGTSERFKSFNLWMKSNPFIGKVRPMVFIDRDGVINEDLGWISNIGDFKMYPDVPKNIAKLNDLGIRVVVVTNQSVVARGGITLEGLNKMHDHFESLLAAQSAFVDGIYVCPHHPDKGFDEEIDHLKIECECRKPQIGLFQKALNKFPTDIKSTYLIGDSWRDEQAAKKLGIKFLPTRDFKPEITGKKSNLDFYSSSLDSAVSHIVNDLTFN